MKKRIFAVLCAAALVLGLLFQAAASEGAWDKDVIFLAINDQPMSLTDSTMPIKVGGTIYVPYTVFDANQNGGLKLGIFYGGQNKTNNTLTLFDSTAKNLTFDLRTGISYNYFPDGVQQTPKAVIRNGQIYVSAYATADYFNLTCIQSNIVFGANGTSGAKSYTYLRIRTDDVALDDANFMNLAINPFLFQLQSYYNRVTGQGSEAETATPPVTAPTVTPDNGQDRRGVRVYLAVRCETGEAAGAMLDALRGEGGGALLLFTPQELAERDDLVRRALGEGHVVGLITGAKDLTQARQELKQGNELLSHIARASTHIVLAEDPAVAEALAGEGWLCWRENLSALPAGRGSGAVYTALSRSLEARENTTRITLDDSAVSSAVLTRLLRTLREDQYDLRLALETEF